MIYTNVSALDRRPTESAARWRYMLVQGPTACGGRLLVATQRRMEIAVAAGVRQSCLLSPCPSVHAPFLVYECTYMPRPPFPLRARSSLPPVRPSVLPSTRAQLLLIVEGTSWQTGKQADTTLLRAKRASGRTNDGFSCFRAPPFTSSSAATAALMSESGRVADATTVAI